MKKLSFFILVLALFGSERESNAADLIVPTVPTAANIQQPAIGMIVYEASTGRFMGFSGTAWFSFSGTTPLNSYVRMDTGNGYGSTNNKIRIFSNITAQTGADVLYTTSASLGDTFTIVTAGLYAISYSDWACKYGLSLNSTHLTWAIDSLPIGERLISNTVGTYSPVHIVVRLNANDVIRAHTDANCGTYSFTQFVITKLRP